MPRGPDGAVCARDQRCHGSAHALGLYCQRDTVGFSKIAATVADIRHREGVGLQDAHILPRSTPPPPPAQLWLSGASTQDLWDRAGFIANQGVVLVDGSGNVVIQFGGRGGGGGLRVLPVEEQQPGLRAWLQQPGAGAHLSPAQIDALQLFTFAPPPLQQQQQEAGQHGGPPSKDLVPSRTSDAGTGGSPDPEALTEREGGGGGAYLRGGGAALFVSPLAYGFPAGVVPDTACAVCQCDYEAGDVLRVLPCSGGGGGGGRAGDGGEGGGAAAVRHAFHRACADTWLAMQATCPVCRARILGAAAGAAAAATPASASGATSLPMPAESGLGGGGGLQGQGTSQAVGPGATPS